jgi:hypothetical protein
VKRNLALLMILVGAFFFIRAGIHIIGWVTRDESPNSVVLALGIAGAVLFWRGLRLRHPDGFGSDEPPRGRGEWTSRTGTAQPTFLTDRTPESPDAQG